MTGTPTAAHALNIARSQIGFLEGPNNRNPYGPALDWPDNQRYCDEFVSWVGWKAGGQDIIGRHYNCAEHVKWFKARGRFGKKPLSGAVVFFDWDGHGVADHTGFVESLLGAAHVTTIEGNTDHPSVRGRQGVWRRNRSTRLVLGYGYPEYATPRMAPVPLPAAPHRLHVVPLVVDGVIGPVTARRLQQHLHVPVDGVIGPVTVRALQAWVGAPRDGQLGPVTIRRLQAVLRVRQDGILGRETARALQRWLNR